MTRKDYILISNIINQQHESCATVNLTLDNLSKELAEVLQADNSRFDRGRFLTACGVN